MTARQRSRDEISAAIAERRSILWWVRFWYGSAPPMSGRRAGFGNVWAGLVLWAGTFGRWPGNDEFPETVWSMYIDRRDWWVGYYRGDSHHYVCPVLCLVIRWKRSGQS